jgi:hypothetical protein
LSLNQVIHDHESWVAFTNHFERDCEVKTQVVKIKIATRSLPACSYL